MCVGFEKVQSDDPQLPDSLCNTFTKAGKEGESQPPLYSPLIIPHYLHIALEAGMRTPKWKDSAAVCHHLQPVCNLQSLLLSPLDLGSRSWNAPISSSLATFCEEGPVPPVPCVPPSDSGKNHTGVCIL